MRYRDFPNCDQVQQLRCNICFPHIVPIILIEKKTKGKRGIIASLWDKPDENACWNDHLELLTSCVGKVVAKNNISRSQIMGDKGLSTIHLANKCSKVTFGAIFVFWGSKIPYILLFKQ
jgi:hypothetical protein